MLERLPEADPASTPFMPPEKGHYRSMEQIQRSTPRVRPFTQAAFAVLLALGSILLAGCGGGGSTSVISTGFPAGNGTNTLVVPAISGGGQLSLTASNLPQPVTFPPPSGASDTDTRLQNTASPSGSPKFPAGLSYVKGSAYQLSKPNATFAFPASIILKITYPLNGIDAQTVNIYYFDGTAFQPVAPVAGGFSTTASGMVGTVTTTINTFQGTGLYAVFAITPPLNPS